MSEHETVMQLCGMWFRRELVGAPHELQTLAFRAFQDLSDEDQDRITTARVA